MDLKKYILENDGLVISEGTCRDGDLLSSFLPIIEQYDTGEYKATIDWCYNFINDNGGTFGWLADLDDVDSDDFDLMAWAVNDWMWERMNRIAPEGFYFGANEGDSSCFGFWKVENTP